MRPGCLPIMADIVRQPPSGLKMPAAIEITPISEVADEPFESGRTTSAHKALPDQLVIPPGQGQRAQGRSSLRILAVESPSRSEGPAAGCLLPNHYPAIPAGHCFTGRGGRIPLVPPPLVSVPGPLVLVVTLPVPVITVTFVTTLTDGPAGVGAEAGPISFCEMTWRIAFISCSNRST